MWVWHLGKLIVDVVLFVFPRPVSTVCSTISDVGLSVSWATVILSTSHFLLCENEPRKSSNAFAMFMKLL